MKYLCGPHPGEQESLTVWARPPPSVLQYPLETLTVLAGPPPNPFRYPQEALRFVWWAVTSVMVVVLVVCLGEARGKEVAVEEQQQQDGGGTDSCVRLRIREIMRLISSKMEGFMSRSSHDRPDSGLKDIVEERLEREIVEGMDSSLDEEREMSHTYCKERLEDLPVTEDTPYTSKDNLSIDALPNSASDDILSDAFSDMEESSRSEGVINSDKRYQSTPGEVLNDHLHHDISVDPARPTCGKDDTFGSCSSRDGGSASRLTLSLGLLPLTAELSDDAEMEMKTSVSKDASQGKALEGVRICDALNGGAEVVEDEEIFSIYTAGNSEEAFNSITVNYDALLSDSTSDENTDMDTDSEGDFLEGEDKYESDDDDSFNLSDYYSDFSDTDDSSDGEMEYVNEAELRSLWYASNSDEEYDSGTSSDKEGEEDKPPTDIGFDVEGEVEGEATVWNGEKGDSEVVIQSQITHA